MVITDRRLSVERTKQGDWNLHIKHVQHNDSGQYLCQINTTPVKIKRVRLKVLGKSSIFIFFFYLFCLSLKWHYAQFKIKSMCKVEG